MTDISSRNNYILKKTEEQNKLKTNLTKEILEFQWNEVYKPRKDYHIGTYERW